ncbi:VTT domain-containing protein [Candidatus Pacearchaeota archaeon]|nr:VTT domain-containing protein [Candidatus Pacearchaeota archaeon]
MKNYNFFLKKQRITTIAGILLIVALFILFSILSKIYLEDLRAFIVKDSYGMILYVILLLVESIIGPLSFLPLVAVASNLWGWVVTGFLNWFAWVLGAVIVFVVSRKYGKCFIENIFSIDKVIEIESYIPQKGYFWSLIFWRMVLPADLLNYGLGLLSDIDFKTYFLTTIIGIAPFSFIIAYFGILSTIYQLIGFLVGILVLSLALRFSSKSKSRQRRKEELEKKFKNNERETCKIK